MLYEDIYDKIKTFLKSVPVVQWSLNQKGQILDKINQRQELFNLIYQNRYVVIHFCSSAGKYSLNTSELFIEVVKEWLDLYGGIRLRKKTDAIINAPEKSVLLYAPQSLLRIPVSHEAYLAHVGHNARQMIRKANKHGYEFKEFIWDDHLDEIYEINTSKKIRQDIPIRGWYKYPVQPRNHSIEELQFRKYYGAFKDGKLWAYLHFWICGDFAIPKHIMGHAQHLTYGIMNGLISYTVKKCIEISNIRWLYYGLHKEGHSLSSFKKHVGFHPYAIILDLKDDEELLKYSEHTIKTWWRT